LADAAQGKRRTYQTQVAELTKQLKEMQAGMDAKMAATPELTQENEMLRAIIMRQLRAQHRQQAAKDLMISELQKWRTPRMISSSRSRK
jgi:hypothetical protein